MQEKDLIQPQYDVEIWQHNNVTYVSQHVNSHLSLLLVIAICDTKNTFPSGRQ